MCWKGWEIDGVDVDRSGVSDAMLLSDERFGRSDVVCLVSDLLHTLAGLLIMMVDVDEY